MDTASAISMLRKRSPEKVQAWVLDRLTGRDLQPFADPRTSESPADIVAELLEQLPADDPLREDVVRGCRRFAGQLLGDLTSQSPLRGDTLRRARQLCLVLEVARPQELKDIARMVFDAVTRDWHPLDELRPDAVRCLFTMGVEKEQIDLWENTLEDERVAAYAVRAFIELDPTHERVVDALVELWRHRLQDGWRTDVIGLLCRATEAAGANAEDVGRRIVRALRRQKNWPKIEKELTDDPYGRAWLQQRDEDEARRPRHGRLQSARERRETLDVLLSSFWQSALRTPGRSSLVHAAQQTNSDQPVAPSSEREFTEENWIAYIARIYVREEDHEMQRGVKRDLDAVVSKWQKKGWEVEPSDVAGLASGHVK